MRANRFFAALFLLIASPPALAGNMTANSGTVWTPFVANGGARRQFRSDEVGVDADAHGL